MSPTNNNGFTPIELDTTLTQPEPEIIGADTLNEPTFIKSNEVAANVANKKLALGIATPQQLALEQEIASVEAQLLQAQKNIGCP